MKFHHIYPILLIVCSFMACQSKHKLVFSSNINESKILLPPKGCYGVVITANGSLRCNSIVTLFMDGRKTNFLDHLTLDGSFENQTIYTGDWYENSIQLKLSNGKCIDTEFILYVEFLD